MKRHVLTRTGLTNGFDEQNALLLDGSGGHFLPNAFFIEEIVDGIVETL
jgi:hypothetical protein